jgi:hypothetical protein
MTSEWCDSHHWWKDAKFSNQSIAIPRNQIDEVEIDSSFFAYSIIDNAQCYSQIPFLQCNNINIVLSTGGIVSNGGNTRGYFTCAELVAENVVAGNDIIFSHWYPNTYCQWNINSFSGGKNDINKIIFEGLDYFILNNKSSINNSYISSNTINLSGVNLNGNSPYFTTLKAKKSDLFSILIDSSGVGDRIQYNGSFLLDNCNIEGSGNGKFIFQNQSVNNASLTGSFLFQESFNIGKLYGRDIFFASTGTKGCINSGTIYGDVIFSGVGSINAGVVSGITTFVSGAINKGIILEPAIFYSGTLNKGLLKKYSWFDYAINDGPLISGAKFTFAKNQYNIGDGSGNFLFANNSENRGSIGNSGIISFISGSSNWSELNAPAALTFFDSASFNKSVITGIASFGSGCVNGGSLVTGIFNKDSINSGNIFNLGIFNNISINVGNATGAIFYGQSANSGKVGSGRFESFSHNGKDVGYGSFYGNSQNISGATAQNAIFCNQSSNMSGSNIGLFAEFGQNSINYASGNYSCNFFENAINYAYLNNRLIFFSGSSINKNYAKGAVFFDNAFNDKMAGIHSGYFLNNSTNYGYAQSGDFFHRSKNQNLGVLEIANFHDFSINNSSMRRPFVSGQDQFTYGARQIEILDSGINNASLENVAINFKNSGINNGKLNWTPIEHEKFIFTSSGILTIDSVYDAQSNAFIYYTGNITNESFLTLFNKSPSIIFQDNTINRGNIFGYKQVIFKNTGINYANISIYPVFPSDHITAIFNGTTGTGAICSNYGNIEHTVNFKDSINYGTIDLGLFDRSINSGNILGISGTLNFINSSKNFGALSTFAIFNNSKNFNNINSSGNFSGSVNFGDITRDAIFTDSDNYGDIGGNLTMNNSLCFASNVGGIANFDKSEYVSSIFASGATFTDGALFGDAAFNPSKSYFSYRTSDIDIDIFLARNKIVTKNSVISNTGFFNQSTNYGGYLANGGSFNKSINFGNIDGPSSFGNSINAYLATLNGLCSFGDNSINYGNIINGRNDDIKNNIDPTILYFYRQPYVSGFIQDNICSTVFINSTNKGTINGVSIFSNSKNSHFITGKTLFLSSTNDNSDTIERIEYVPPYPIYPIPIIQRVGTKTYIWSNDHILQSDHGYIFGDYIFYYSINNGSIENGGGIFDNSENKNIINTNSDSLFINSTNKGIATNHNTTFEFSKNKGTVIGNATFISGQNYHLVSGDAIFISGSCYDTFSQVIGTITEDGTLTECKS